MKILQIPLESRCSVQSLGTFLSFLDLLNKSLGSKGRLFSFPFVINSFIQKLFTDPLVCTEGTAVRKSDNVTALVETLFLYKEDNTV